MMTIGVERSYDVISMGRSLIDLYSNQVGVPFNQINSFAAYVGGCPTNIGVGCRRLGLRTVALTAVGDDLIGDFVLDFLTREGIVTDFARRKPGRRTSAVLLAMDAERGFPNVAYRDNGADTELTIDDVEAAPIDDSRALLLTGSALAREPGRSATLYAAERARSADTRVFLDLDYRADYWHDERAYGVALRSLLRNVDVAIGTQDEVSRAIFPEAKQSDPPRDGIAELLLLGPEALVMKRGAESTLTYLPNGEVIEAAPFKVEVYNLLGAGDAFAGGLIYGRLKGYDWHRATRIGNACGAVVVTRHGCANFMPYEEEILKFIEEHGGF